MKMDLKGIKVSAIKLPHGAVMESHVFLPPDYIVFQEISLRVMME